MLSPDQLDALREITNVAMGRAGASLAELFDQRVLLSVPDVDSVSSDELRARCSATLAAGGEFSLVRQSFYGGVRGEAIVLHTRQGAGVAPAGYPHESSEAAQRELLLDVSSMQVGAIVSAFARELGTDVVFSRPSALAMLVEAAEVLKSCTYHWDSALLVEVSFALASGEWSSRTHLLLPPDSAHALRKRIETLLEELAHV